MPFLFLVVAEGLSILMRMVVEKKLFDVEVGNTGLRESCPQFADDTLFLVSIGISSC